MMKQTEEKINELKKMINTLSRYKEQKEKMCTLLDLIVGELENHIDEEGRPYSPCNER